MNVKPCKYCWDPEPNHWPYQCFKNPKRPKPIKKMGKISVQWKKFREQWMREHTELWFCYLCGEKLNRSTLTLDHVLPRSRRPDLRTSPENIKPACWSCNNSKGSKVLDS